MPSWKKSSFCRSRKSIRKERRLALTREQRKMILETCLLVEGKRIDVLLLSINTMLTVTRDLIQNNEVIPIESIRALNEQNEVLRKKVKDLNRSILRKYR